MAGLRSWGGPRSTSIGLSTANLFLPILVLLTAACQVQGRPQYDVQYDGEDAVDFQGFDNEDLGDYQGGDAGVREGQFLYGPVTASLIPARLNPAPYINHYLRNAFMQSPPPRSYYQGFQQNFQPYFYQGYLGQPSYFPRYRRSAAATEPRAKPEGAVAHKEVEDHDEDGDELEVLLELGKYYTETPRTRDVPDSKVEMEKDDHDDDDDDDDNDDDDDDDDKQDDQAKALRYLIKSAIASSKADGGRPDYDTSTEEGKKRLRQEVLERAVQRIINLVNSVSTKSTPAAATAKTVEEAPVPATRPQVHEQARQRRFVDPMTFLGGLKLAEIMAGGAGGLFSSPGLGSSSSGQLATNRGYFRDSSASLVPADYYGQSYFNDNSPGITAADYGQSYFDEMSSDLTPAYGVAPGGAF